MFGKLYFDNDPKASLEEKLARLAEQCRKAHGFNPVTCYLHPSQAGDRETAAGLALAPRLFVLPNHFVFSAEETS